MTQTTSQLSDKELVILDGALELLKETGDAGLTMRKLADRVGMRLSNVQYYFNARDDVLKAMATRYFAECSEQIKQMMKDNADLAPRERVRVLILTGLHHGDGLSDMCRIFRELWAISSRNEVIRDHMADYYRTFSTQIAEFVLGAGANEESCRRVASLLMPFFEGYSVTASSVPMPKEQVVDMLTDLAMSVVRQPEGTRP
ncbi:MAG: TetR/AcrR family transcriptional regulator [Pseudomonadota bacterium]